MDTRLDTSSGNNSPLPSAKAPTDSIIERQQRGILNFDLILLLCAVVAALIPRIVLALQLDVTTDEVVYLFAGKIYLPLLAHFNVGSDYWAQHLYNNEHPPVAKLLMGVSIALNKIVGSPLSELVAGRLPSIVMGSLLVAAVYWLGREPFGRRIAFLGALALAFSPWMAYFSAIAYLDMTMTAFITVAYLVLWHATRRPILFVLVAVLVGLGAASKYTAVLIVPGIVLYAAYYYFIFRPCLPAEERPALPWKIWGITIVAALVAFYICDPAIWVSPIHRLINSFSYEWQHSVGGHEFFIAGTYVMHVQKWGIAFIIFTKMSAFLTIPAVFFVVFALVQLVRFHLGKVNLPLRTVQVYAYLVIWLLSSLCMFSLLNIVVGTHYHIPLAAPVALAGVYGLVIIVGAVAKRVWKQPAATAEPALVDGETTATHTGTRPRFQPAFAIPLAIVGILAVLPHLLGLVTVYGAEGYTTEFFGDNENNTLQVAYVGYRDGLLWLESDQPSAQKVGLIATVGTLTGYGNQANWFYYNTDLTKRFQLAQVLPTDPGTISQYHYLIWPKHLVQRGDPLPSGFHIIHEIMGGNTIYCYILEANS